jgi:thiol-disulfide isomerase/thioredoxin
MLSISLGPVALPSGPVVLLGAVWAASWLASRLVARDGEAGQAGVAGNTIFNAALCGLLAARLAHLALNAQAYMASPGSALDLRDGGWNAPAGALAGAAWLVVRGLRVPALRWPLGGGALAGAALWLAASLATGLGQTQTMPALTLTSFEGGQAVDLAQAARGRPVVVNLWASWCGPCRQEMPLLAAAQQRESSVGFIFVNQGESASAVRAYLRDQGLPLREVLLDPGSALGPAIGSRGLPTTLFYDARGRQVDAHFGVLNAGALESRLGSLRAGR